MLRISIATLICVSLAHAGDAVIKLGIDSWAANYPANVAESKGFWKAEGVQVEIVHYDTDTERARAISGGIVHLGNSMLGSAVTWHLEGTPMRILAETDWSHGGDKVIAGKGVEVAALAGKQIGVYSADIAVAFFLSKVLASKGVDIAAVELAELEPEALTQQLLAGNLPLIANYDPQADLAVKGGGRLVATTADFAGVMPEGLVGRADKLGEIPAEQLAKFMRGWAKAVTWSQDPAHFAELSTIVRTQTVTGDDAPKTDADVRELLAGVRVHDAKALVERNREGLPVWLREVNLFLVATKRKGLDPGALVDPGFIASALAP